MSTVSQVTAEVRPDRIKTVPALPLTSLQLSLVVLQATRDPTEESAGVPGRVSWVGVLDGSLY